jgi:hypothetical protein
VREADVGQILEDVSVVDGGVAVRHLEMRIAQMWHEIAQRKRGMEFCKRVIVKKTARDLRAEFSLLC